MFTVSRRAVENALVPLFIAAIFVGDVWLVKYTLPLAILLLPALCAVHMRRIVVPLPLFLLVGLLALVVVQFLLGRYLHWRSDLPIWTPLVFAALTIVCLYGVSLSPARTLRSFGLGGVASGGVMLGMICLAPSSFFLVPGQNFFETGENFKQSLLVEADAEAARYQRELASYREKLAAREMAKTLAPEKGTEVAPNDGSSVEPIKPSLRTPPPELEVTDHPMSEDTRLFYGLKNRARNFLGGSNYIAVFFTFVFAVALFCERPLLAAAMAALVCLTLSRFGFAFIGLIGASYWLYRRGASVSTICAGIAVIGVLAFALAFGFRGYLHQFASVTSLVIRLDLLESAFPSIEKHPLIGAARSLVIEERNFNIIWNPHNSIASLLVNFGLIGLLLYVGYVAIVLRTVVKASSHSNLWRGVLVGLTVLLIWSLCEVIVLTPAFELLLATIYVLASTAKENAVVPRPAEFSGARVFEAAR